MRALFFYHAGVKDFSFNGGEGSMGFGDIFLIIVIPLTSLMIMREGVKGYRRGAVDTLVTGSAVRVYAYKSEQPISFYFHVIFYILAGIAGWVLILYLYLWR
ncbi:DUF2542 family protein [Serratia entomophila]|uniref:DUF2542 family protein n=1 Tax=Serratia entomophila TaxID=42906 RepID=UPI0021BD9515|nr:DUF2542 family protein [Serratia entomophila]